MFIDSREPQGTLAICPGLPSIGGVLSPIGGMAYNVSGSGHSLGHRNWPPCQSLMVKECWIYHAGYVGSVPYFYSIPCWASVVHSGILDHGMARANSSRTDSG